MSGIDDIVIRSPKLGKYISVLRKKSEDIEEDIVIQKLSDIFELNPHLKRYFENFKSETGIYPKYRNILTIDMGDIESVNVVYPVGDPIFIHVLLKNGKMGKYITIQPELTEEEEKKYKAILDLILRKAVYEELPDTPEKFEKIIDNLIKNSVEIGTHKIFSKGKIYLKNKEEHDKLRYRIKRDLIFGGILEPMLRDPYLEDVHSIGTGNLHVYHKIFGMLETNVKFNSRSELEDYLRRISEHIGKSVTDVKPIVDAALPDGSRINIIYSDDVSREGPSFTIRKFPKKPLTITQLVKWGTYSPELMAYLWLCIEHGLNICVSGETSSGKTTTLNSLLTFVRPSAKVYTAEDTPELVIPHKVWQRLITRDMGPEESRIDLFELVKASLRSRPDVVIIGEVRGREGFAAFQAMQTGHEVMYTFHASSIQKMIQRFIGKPINVPVRFFDNLNVALFQQIIYEHGKIKRRCSTVDEILGYSKEKGGVLTRTVFTWDPVLDKHYFRGIYNSYILETKIAPKLGYENPRQIYDDLKFRARIIRNMVTDNILGYDEVNKIFATYYEEGYEGLPPRLRREF